MLALVGTMSARVGQLLTVVLLSALVLLAAAEDGRNKLQGVTYDGRSLIINGKRELLFSGSIHYPRSTPDVTPFEIKLVFCSMYIPSRV